MEIENKDAILNYVNSTYYSLVVPYENEVGLTVEVVSCGMQGRVALSLHNIKRISVNTEDHIVVVINEHRTPVGTYSFNDIVNSLAFSASVEVVVKCEDFDAMMALIATVEANTCTSVMVLPTDPTIPIAVPGTDRRFNYVTLSAIGVKQHVETLLNTVVLFFDIPALHNKK